jgi:hypothetical protein
MSAVLRLALVTLLLLPGAKADAHVLSPEGYGSVRFGMKVQQAELALKQHVTKPYSSTGCDYVEFRKYPGLRFMVEDGVLTRADARKNISNSAKVRVGMTLAKVREMHPSVKVDPHKYDDDGHYLILNTANGYAAIVLEESNGKVTHVRAGIKPAVEYVEGCL